MHIIIHSGYAISTQTGSAALYFYDAGVSALPALCGRFLQYWSRLRSVAELRISPILCRWNHHSRRRHSKPVWRGFQFGSRTFNLTATVLQVSGDGGPATLGRLVLA